MEGKLYANINNYEYKFPVEENEKNFTIINFIENSINEEKNFKFCYSSNLGILIEDSKENCFKNGRYIPYSFKFINPLIVAKNTKAETDKYYILFMPFNDTEFINIEVTEEQYENIHKYYTLNSGKPNFI